MRSTRLVLAMTSAVLALVGVAPARATHDLPLKGRVEQPDSGWVAARVRITGDAHNRLSYDLTSSHVERVVQAVWWLGPNSSEIHHYESKDFQQTAVRVFSPSLGLQGTPYYPNEGQHTDGITDASPGEYTFLGVTVALEGTVAGALEIYGEGVEVLGTSSGTTGFGAQLEDFAPAVGVRANVTPSGFAAGVVAAVSGRYEYTATDRVFALFSGGGFPSGVSSIQIFGPDEQSSSGGGFLGTSVFPLVVSDGSPGNYEFRVSHAVQATPLFLVGASVSLP